MSNEEGRECEEEFEKEIEKSAEEELDDDPALIFVVGNDGLIHDACGLPHSPVPQGNTVQETVRTFKLWFFGVINSHGGASGRFIPPTTFDLGNTFIYHELRLNVYQRIVAELSRLDDWGTAIAATPMHSLGTVLVVTGSGRGSLVITSPLMGPFR